MPGMAGTSGAACAQGRADAAAREAVCVAPPSRGLTVGVLCAAAAYLYARLFTLRGIPFLTGGDQAYFWEYAERMLHGQRPYVDFFQFTPPGTDFFYLTLFKIFGARVWVTNAAILALGVALCWVCLRIASAIMERGLAVLATAVFLVLIYARLQNGTHHWFSALLVLAAVAVAIEGQSTGRMAAAGALLGASCFFTQTHGVMALGAFVLWIAWREWDPTRSGNETRVHRMGRTLGALLLGFCAGLGAIGAYGMATVGLGRLWYFEVTYVGRHMLRGMGGGYLGLPDDAFAWRQAVSLAPVLFVYALLPAIYPVALTVVWREGRCGSAKMARANRGAGLVALVGISWLAEVAVSPNWLRVYAVAMPGIILLLWLVGRSGRWRSRLAALAWIGIACMTVHQTAVKHHHPYATMLLPAGAAAMNQVHAEKLGWLMQRTQPGQYFFEPFGPGLAFSLQLRNPAFADDISRPEYVAQAIQQLEEKRVRYVLWSAWLNRDDLGSLWKTHLPELRGYITQRYERVKVFTGGDEVWERK
ncbi:MAG TPA: hypothetical protein VN661_12550 [Candidatus Acidoferrales bacterium]|nr:hypothetical protein [Candidatus Acidoferrales bacterium]